MRRQTVLPGSPHEIWRPLAWVFQEAAPTCARARSRCRQVLLKGCSMFRPYHPHPWFAGSHRMTVYAWARRRTFLALPPAEARLFRLGPTTQVLAHCHWQPQRAACPTVVLLHGLEGSSHAHYIKGMAAKAYARGWNAVRLNQRNCGETDHLSEGLYHSGLSADPRGVIRELIQRDGLPRFAVIGYSLGGNVALRLAGDLAEIPVPEVRAVCAVSAPIDLAVCMDLMEEPQNRLYEWYFMLGLRERLKRKARLYPHLYQTDGLKGLWSVRGFDDRYTAPHNGFRDAADYYHRASALRVVAQIRVPTLMLTAADDPFISPAPYRDPAVSSNPALHVVVTPHGGHCGFVERPSAGGDGYWAEDAALSFVSTYVSEPDRVAS